jgi:hypothetical protein
VKHLLLVCTGFVSFSAFAVDLGPKKLVCSFTEPFFELELDVNKAELTKTEYNWEREENDQNAPEFITTVVAKNLMISTKPIGTTYQLQAKTKNGKPLLSATLNYQGNDGMSDVLTPFDGLYQDPERKSKLYGACTTETGGAHKYLEESHPYYEFTKNVGLAVGLCYNRALAGWTDAPSAYKEDQTVFYTLYAREIPVGEPGEVSSTFASAEGEDLFRLVKLTKTPPEDGASLYSLRQAKWDYCDYYSSALHSRIEAYGED